MSERIPEKTPDSNHTPPSSQQIKQGELGIHKIIHEVAPSAGWEKFVPRDALFSEYPFRHKASRAWKQSKFAGVILLVILTIMKKFGVWKPEAFKKQEQEVGLNQLIRLKNERAKTADLSVQENLKRLFGENFEEELAKQKPKNREEIPDFLKKVNERKELLMEAATVGYGKEEPENRLKKLNALIQETTDEYLGTQAEDVKGRFEKLERPNAKQLFSLYQESEKEEVALNQKGDPKNALIQEAIQKKKEMLSSVKKEIEEKISLRQKDAENELNNAITLDLKEGLKKRQGLPETISKLQTELREAKTTYTAKEKNLTILKYSQENDPERLTQLQTARQKKLEELTQKDKESFLNESEDIDNKLKEIDAKDQRLRELEAKREQQKKETGIKKLGTFVASLVSKEDQELNDLMTGSVERARQRQALEESRKALEIKYQEAIQKVEKETLAGLFDREIAGLNNKLQSLPGQIQKATEEKERASQNRIKKEEELSLAQKAHRENEISIQNELQKIQPQIKSFSQTSAEKVIFEEMRQRGEIQEKPINIEERTKERLNDASFQKTLSSELTKMGLPTETINLLK